MSLQAIPGTILIPDLVSYSHGSAWNDLLIDASGEKVAFVTRVPKTGTITKVGFRTRTVTTSAALKVSLQGVNTSGDPNGTILGGGTAYGILSSPASNTWYLVTLNAGLSVNKFDPIAAVIEFSSTVGSLNIGAAARGWGARQLYNAYVDHYTTAWTKYDYLISVAFVYSDNSYGTTPFVHPISAIGAYTFNSGSTPDEYGNYFKLPFPVRAVGMVADVDLDQDSTFKLYDSDGTTVLASVVVNASQRYSTAAGLIWGLFSTPVNLLKNTWYRMTIVPNGTTNISLSWIDAADMSAFPLGQNCYQTSRTDGGAWTEDTVTRVEIALLVDSFDDGVGAGGVSRTRVQGGM